MKRYLYELQDCENLAKLVQAKRHLDKASGIFNDVFDEEGAPNDIEDVQERFFDAIADCEKMIERLVGASVYHYLFTDDNSSTHAQQSPR